MALQVYFSLGTFAQKDDSIAIKKIANEVLTNGNAYENLRYLCKKIGPRLSGSAQAQKAVEATAKMLKDAGADTVYLQPCMVPHWVRGEKETGYIKLANGEKYNLNLCALGNSEGTGKNGITAPVIEVKSFPELEQLGAAVIKGKIVFFNFEMNPTYITMEHLGFADCVAGRTSGGLWPNWKIAYDGYLDFYHLPILHRNTFGADYNNKTRERRVWSAPTTRRTRSSNARTRADLRRTTGRSGTVDRRCGPSFHTCRSPASTRVVSCTRCLSSSQGDTPETSVTVQNFLATFEPDDESQSVDRQADGLPHARGLATRTTTTASAFNERSRPGPSDDVDLRTK